MAQQTTIRLVDDLDGGEADESVEFALDGKPYAIDLSADNAARLREAIAPFLASARRAGKALARSTGAKMTVNRSASGRSREETQAIRAWAARNNIECAERGRINAVVLEAYEQYGGGDFLQPAIAAGDIRPVASGDSDTLKTGTSTPETVATATSSTTEPKSTTAKRKPVSGNTEPPAPGQSAPTMGAMVAFRESRGLPMPKSKQLGKAMQAATTTLMGEAGLL